MQLKETVRIYSQWGEGSRRMFRYEVAAIREVDTAEGAGRPRPPRCNLTVTPPFSSAAQLVSGVPAIERYLKHANEKETREAYSHSHRPNGWWGATQPAFVMDRTLAIEERCASRPEWWHGSHWPFRLSRVSFLAGGHFPESTEGDWETPMLRRCRIAGKDVSVSARR